MREYIRGFFLSQEGAKAAHIGRSLYSRLFPGIRSKKRHAFWKGSGGEYMFTSISWNQEQKAACVLVVKRVRSHIYGHFSWTQEQERHPLREVSG